MSAVIIHTHFAKEHIEQLLKASLIKKSDKISKTDLYFKTEQWQQQLKLPFRRLQFIQLVLSAVGFCNLINLL